MKPSARKLFFFWLLLAILGFVLVELSLRTVGFLYTSYYDRKLNRAANLRILTLGESTTATAYAPDQQPWPVLLKDLLVKKGLDVEVMNAASPAVTSKYLLRVWPGRYERFKPQIVVSMMGINDPSLRRPVSFWFRPEFRWIYELRTAKFLGVAMNMLKWNSTPQTQHWESRPRADSLGFKRVRELTALFRKGDEASAAGMIDSFLKNKNSVDRARFYSFLAIELQLASATEIEKVTAERKANDLLKLALENSIEIDAMPGFIVGSAKLGRPENCAWLLQRQKEMNWLYISPVYLRIYRKCLPDSHPLMAEVIRVAGAAHNGVDASLQKRNFKSIRYYRAFYEEFQRQGVCWVLMTYPLRGTGGIPEFFEQIKHSAVPVALVNNDEPFRQALRKFPANEIFLDFFAGDFGHTTKLGHSLIAENVVEEVVRLAASGKCGEAAKTK